MEISLITDIQTLPDFFFFQDGLKRRMVQLKTRVEEATKAVAEERQRNVQLLNLIFPADVSKKLWLGNGFVFFALKLFCFLCSYKPLLYADNCRDD